MTYSAPKEMNSKTRQIKKGLMEMDGLLFRVIVLIVSILLLYIVWVNREKVENFAQYGYLGLFTVNFISAATIFFPAPGTATVFLGGAVWNPLIVGIVSGLGAGIGELFGYFLGFGGRGLLKTDAGKNEWVKKMEKRFQKSGFWTTFFFALIPIPVFDVIGVIAGAVNYPVWKFLLATTFARILRNILFAFTGAKFFP